MRAPSMALAAPQTRVVTRLEDWLDSERDQLPLWIPVMFGLGIALWFTLPDERGWTSIMLGGAALTLGSFAFRPERRFARVILIAGLCVGLGCGFAWWRSASVASPVLLRPTIASFSARVDRVEAQPAKEAIRMLLRPDAEARLPPLIRVSVKAKDIDRMPIDGDRVTLRARLVPPPQAAVPGAYDFSRAAWYLGIGATGSAMGKIATLTSTPLSAPSLRERLSAHVQSQLSGSEGGIAAAFASGDRGAIARADEESMRDSGLTHLLSISGLHITAVIGAAMFFALRLLALSPWLALRMPLLTIAAGCGAAAGIGYTLLTGAEVPTVRSCIAAMLVLIGLTLGREALTLRLVATGALLVMMVRPESVIGPSFQLSFAAIATIVAVHENAHVKRLTQRREEEGVMAASLRSLLSLLVTGVAVELALAPIALFHFHKSGLYGALANIIAIPLTTFVIMPLEALALLFDTIGVGAPFWWATGQALSFLLGLSRMVAALPGSVAALPSFPASAFAMIVGGGLWLILWKSRVRVLGITVIVAGVGWAIVTPAPDLLVTGDGKHMAVRGDYGDFAVLRPRAGDYVRDTMAEAMGTLDPLDDLDVLPGADCGPDMCMVRISSGARDWRIAATRSAYRLPWQQLINTCRAADIIISDRRLPTACAARWIKIDPDLLRRTGGLAINLASATVRRVNASGDRHPWVLARSAQ
ncbi:MAG: ComEC/Rec2 family competence protein [Sphingomonadaceae bacterium]